MSATLSQTAENGEVLIGAVEEATGTLGTMIDNVGAIAARIHQVDQVSRQSVADTRDNGERLQDSISSIGQRSDEIGKIVKVIEPETLARQLRGPGGGMAVVVVTRVAGAPTVLVCGSP